jgi:hypothetical protein
VRVGSRPSEPRGWIRWPSCGTSKFDSVVNEQGQSRFARAGSEFLVIVVGVLVALACDAWWKSYLDRVREAAILRDLLTEFTANREQLSGDIIDNEASLHAANTLVRLGDSAIRLLPLDSARALAGQAFTLRTFDPLNAVLRSVVETGEFGLISDPELRSALAAWDDGLVELRLLKHSLSVWSNNHILPRLFAGPETTLTVTDLVGSLGLFVPHQRHLQSALNESQRQLTRADTVIARLQRALR